MRTTSRVLPALLLVLLAAARARALDPERPLGLFSLQSWQTQNGLPQNTVEAIVQTRDGYMWLATQEGLVRFDGARFVTFDRNNTPGMPTNHVTALLEAGDDTLWAGTLGGGLLRWRGTAKAVEAVAGLSSDSVTALAQDREGRLWIGTPDHGVDVLEGDRVRTNAVPNLPSPQVRALLVARDGSVWVGTFKGLARLRDGKVDVFTTAQGLGSDSVYALAEDDRGLWVGTGAGLGRKEAERFRTFTKKDGLSHDFVRALHVGDGAVWIGTAGGGVDRWHDGAIDTFTSRDGLPSDTVLSLYVNREGALWIGTDGGGLNRLSEGKVTAFGPRQGLANHDVYTVAGTRDGGLLAGSYQGDVDVLEGTRFRRLVPGTQVGSARVRTLLEDSRGDLWIGNEQGLWHQHAGMVRRVAGSEPTVRALTEDAAGTVWVGTDGAGLFRVEGGKLVAAVPELRAAQVRDIQPEEGGRLWVGTYTGLALIDGGKVHTFKTADGLPHDYIRSIHRSADGTLWLGTYGGGLSRYRNGAFTNFGVKQGLLSDVIYSIVEDAGHDLWMTCNRGIFRVAIKDLEAVADGRAARVAAQAFDESDGMPTRECNGGNPGAFRMADGRMWFATLGGVAMIDTARTKQNRVPPPVVIDRVLADGVEVVGPGRGGALLPLSLQPRPRRLEFQFAGLSFVAPEKVRYRYQLEGYDPDWVDAGTSRTAHYTGLPPRHYVFRVKASNSDGFWNETGAVWDFTLEPALHERAWFPIAVGLALMVGAVVLHQWRILALRRSEQRLQARVADAVARIKTLSGLLPICAACKKIRDDQGYWEQIEVYIRDHSDAQFSHGLCPTCIRAMYPEFADAVLSRE